MTALSAFEQFLALKLFDRLEENEIDKSIKPVWRNWKNQRMSRQKGSQDLQDFQDCRINLSGHPVNPVNLG